MHQPLKKLFTIALFGSLLACGGDSEETVSPETVEHTPAATAPATEEATADASPADVQEPASACICDQGKAGETVWCDSCGAGYHDSEKLTCQACYEAAQTGTTHAHDAVEDPGSTPGASAGG